MQTTVILVFDAVKIDAGCTLKMYEFDLLLIEFAKSIGYITDCY